ncbi:MAG: ABC-F family ATP-binding cassette domain-containing protein [Phycisphaerales bacterium]|nr:ABC-F family ATP-binding cassette domain-containing protein [Phycisphaerales bacterium]
MSLLTLANIRHSYGSHAVLDGATVSIEAGEKVGLVGRNGSGKTTLMKVMLGQLKPDSGMVALQRNARSGYLSQDPNLDPDDTVRDAAERAFAELHELHVQAHHLYEQMAHAQGDDLDRLLKQQAKLDVQIEAAGGYAIDHKIDAMLHGLGFTDEQFSLKVTALSGGQKGRLGLARLLLEEPDLLLLDEPTNHLDIGGRQWLETFLAEEYRGAVIVVSHDRWLLDRVVSRIIEVERGVIREYPGNYHKYIELRRERQLTQARVYDKQVDRIRQEQGFIDRYRAGQRARQAQGRLARLERFKRDELVDRPIELDVMNLQLPPAPRSGEQVFAVEGIGKSYGDKALFNNLDLTVMRGDRIGIIGPNGSGKTTLVKCLLGEVDVNSGAVRQGSRLSVGYYRQLHDHLDMSLTVWQYLQSVIVGLDGQAKASEQQARDLAGAFLFSGIEQEKTLSLLSGGERSRAVLAGLVAGAHNVLVLDEPTNHLDIPSAERLEQALSSDDGGYDGTMLLISHDRQLLEDTCDKLVILDGIGNVRVFPGRYSDWAERQKRTASEPQAKADRAKPPAAKPPTNRTAPAVAGAKSAKPRATGSGLAAITLAKLESQIEELQKQIASIDQQMLDAAVFTDGPRSKQLQTQRARLERELGPLENEWARRAEGP